MSRLAFECVEEENKKENVCLFVDTNLTVTYGDTPFSLLNRATYDVRRAIVSHLYIYISYFFETMHDKIQIVNIMLFPFYGLTSYGMAWHGMVVNSIISFALIFAIFHRKMFKIIRIKTKENVANNSKGTMVAFC